MKKTLLVLISFLVITNITAQENKVKTYQIKSGYVKYKPLEKGAVGTHEIWWDNYGEFLREDVNKTTTTKFLGKKSVSKTHTVTITKGKEIWTADLDKGTGTIGINPLYNAVQEEMGSMSEQKQKETANSILSSLGGQKLGNEKIMGYQCEITKMWGAKVWLYKGVVLKSETKMLGIQTGEVATKFKPNSTVNGSKFKPLSSINYEKAPSYNELLNQLNEEENTEVTPLKYPYEKFKTQMLKYNPKGYKRMGPLSIGKAMYMCTWMRNETDMVYVGASSTDNTEKIDVKEFSKVKGIETFTHKGLTCLYGMDESEDYDDKEGNTPILIVQYKKHDMIVMISGTPKKSKQELLRLFDKFKF